jgi:hypothetical protein
MEASCRFSSTTAENPGALGYPDGGGYVKKSTSGSVLTTQAAMFPRIEGRTAPSKDILPQMPKFVNILASQKCLLTDSGDDLGLECIACKAYGDSSDPCKGGAAAFLPRLMRDAVTRPDSTRQLASPEASRFAVPECWPPPSCSCQLVHQERKGTTNLL